MTRIVVTGAAGFIGSNIIAGLNARGHDDIIAVDDLKQGDKFRNLADLRISLLVLPSAMSRVMSISRIVRLVAEQSSSLSFIMWRSTRMFSTLLQKNLSPLMMA